MWDLLLQSIDSLVVLSELSSCDALCTWPPHAKNWLIGKDPDAGKDCRQKEKGTTENEHHRLNEHEFEQAPGVVMDRGVWHSTVHKVTKRWTRLSDWTEPLDHQGSPIICLLEGLVIEADPVGLCNLYWCLWIPLFFWCIFSSLISFTPRSQILSLSLKAALRLVEMLRAWMSGVHNSLESDPLTEV